MYKVRSKSSKKHGMMYFSPCRELSVLPLVNTKARDFEFKKISRRQMTM